MALFATRLLRSLAGPPLRLPRPVDSVAERWSRVRPRLRALVLLAVAVAAGAWVQARIAAAEARFGGPPVAVLVAEQDVAVGSVPVVVRVELPPVAVPPGAVPADPAGAARAPVSLALPRGAILTRAHTDPRGPSAGLPPGQRVVPVPVEAGWGVAAGGWVDVWVLGAGDRPARLVARSAPVVEVRGDGGPQTALLGLATGEVAAVTGGLAVGSVLLTHAPPPDPRGP